MAGVIIIAVVLLVVIPVGVLSVSAVLAGVLGQVTKVDVDAKYRDTEYLELS
jgi:hypothetical protein